MSGNIVVLIVLSPLLAWLAFGGLALWLRIWWSLYFSLRDWCDEVKNVAMADEKANKAKDKREQK